MKSTEIIKEAEKRGGTFVISNIYDRYGRQMRSQCESLAFHGVLRFKSRLGACTIYSLRSKKAVDEYLSLRRNNAEARKNLCKTPSN
jgi:hypothetical protein